MSVRRKNEIQAVGSQEINDPKPPNGIILYRWVKSYENSKHDIRTLVPRHQNKGDYRPKLHREVIQIINQAIQSIYLTAEKADIADVFQLVCKALRNFSSSLRIGDVFFI
ncbi:MAG: hypothetical protein WBV73_19900 [Phormidium sp.]